MAGVIRDVNNPVVFFDIKIGKGKRGKNDIHDIVCLNLSKTFFSFKVEHLKEELKSNFLQMCAQR